MYTWFHCSFFFYLYFYRFVFVLLYLMLYFVIGFSSIVLSSVLINYCLTHTVMPVYYRIFWFTISTTREITQHTIIFFILWHWWYLSSQHFTIAPAILDLRNPKLHGQNCSVAYGGGEVQFRYVFSPINNDLHLVINPNLWFSVIISHLYFVGNQQKCRLYWYYYCYCYQKYLRYQPFCSILHQVSYKNRLLLKIFVIDSYYLST